MEKVQQAVLRLLFPLSGEKETAVTVNTEGELEKLKTEIAAARTRFEFASTDEETEAAIYDLSAREIRYNLLLRRAKRGEE